MMQNGKLVGEVGYLPLPQKAYDLAWQHFTNGKLGSVFGGVPQVGITIDKLLAMEAKL
jgi:phosphate transport system substrate-binding protein